MVMTLWKNHVASNNKTHLGLHMVGRDSSFGIATGQSGNRIPVGGEIPRTHPERPWDPPSLLYRVFPESNAPI